MVEEIGKSTDCLADALGTGPGCRFRRGDLLFPGWTAFRSPAPANRRRYPLQEFIP